jgi:hypothetical protein
MGRLAKYGRKTIAQLRRRDQSEQVPDQAVFDAETWLANEVALLSLVAGTRRRVERKISHVLRRSAPKRSVRGRKRGIRARVLEKVIWRKDGTIKRSVWRYL